MAWTLKRLPKARNSLFCGPKCHRPQNLGDNSVHITAVPRSGPADGDPPRRGWTKTEGVRICRAMNIGTWLFTKLNGRQLGTDGSGNIYYEEKRPRPGSLRGRRWVMYAGVPEASSVPPEWHAWLHHTTDAPDRRGATASPGRNRIWRTPPAPRSATGRPDMTTRGDSGPGPPATTNPGRRVEHGRDEHGRAEHDPRRWPRRRGESSGRTTGHDRRGRQSCLPTRG